jgi:pimeloyl-ACP methyl ester carboxylesterase
MRLGNLMRLGGLLRRLGGDPIAADHPRIAEQRDLEANGDELDGLGGRGHYDLYRPANKSPRGVVIALHGMTMQGNRDARLVHFARCLALSRVCCVTPRLEGLASCHYRREDLADLGAVVRAVANEQQTKPALLAFSLGGSYALLCAAQPAQRELVRFVLTFGAYHHLGALIDAIGQTHLADPQSDVEWDERIYVEAILALQHGTAAGLPTTLIEGCRELLAGYCRSLSAEDKRAFHRDHLAGRELVDLARRYGDRQPYEDLSPAGKLDGLRCPVGVVHDVADPLVPPAEARALHAELASLDGGERHGLLITPLLTHVDLRTLLRFGELARFFKLLEPLIEHTE